MELDQKLMEINDLYIIYLLQNIQLKQKDLQFATDFGAQTSTALAEEISWLTDSCHISWLF